MRSVVVLVCALLSLGQVAFATVGFQKVSVPDLQGKSLAVALWYPSNSAAFSQALGLYHQDVASDGPILGNYFSRGLFTTEFCSRLSER
jgi:hypothetical protein